MCQMLCKNNKLGKSRLFLRGQTHVMAYLSCQSKVTLVVTSILLLLYLFAFVVQSNIHRSVHGISVAIKFCDICADLSIPPFTRNYISIACKSNAFNGREIDRQRERERERERDNEKEKENLSESAGNKKPSKLYASAHTLTLTLTLKLHICL